MRLIDVYGKEQNRLYDIFYSEKALSTAVISKHFIFVLIFNSDEERGDLGSYDIIRYDSNADYFSVFATGSISMCMKELSNFIINSSHDENTKMGKRIMKAID